MDFLYDIDRFVEKHPYKKIAVFFHTSSVQEPNENLRMFFQRKKSNVAAYIPENCVYELKLLAQYSTIPRFRDNAALLLNCCITKNAWAFRSMYINRSFLSCYHCDIALFVFYEPAAAASFSSRMGKRENVYILSYDLFKIRDDSFNLPKESGYQFTRDCRPLENIAAVHTFSLRDKFDIQDRHGHCVKTLTGDEFAFFNGGGESGIFTTPSMPGKVIKILAFTPGQGMLTKLKLLMAFNAESVAPACVLPTNLLYCHGECVGYVMNQIYGRVLGDVLPSYNEIQCRDLIRKISLALLELRITQFLVTDISPRNIFVDDNGEIKILDCDSMEINAFPGGAVTAPYGHPDVTEDFFYKRLRTPDHFNFSYSVLLFEILMGWTNPLLQKGFGDEELKWRIHAFPYANRNGQGVQAPGLQANETKLELWRKQPQAIREGFEEVFNFRTTYDIGEWIKKIGLF